MAILCSRRIETPSFMCILATAFERAWNTASDMGNLAV